MLLCLYLSETRVTLRTVTRGELALSQRMWWSLMWVCSQHCWWPAPCSSSSVPRRWSTASSAASVEPARKRKGWESPFEKQKEIGEWGIQEKLWHNLILINKIHVGERWMSLLTNHSQVAYQRDAARFTMFKIQFSSISIWISHLYALFHFILC